MFSELVRVHRRRLGLTQQELADTTGLEVRSIRKLESGRVRAPRLATVRRLADAFGLTDAERDGFSQAATPDPPGLAVAPKGIPEHCVPAQLPLDPHGFTGRDRELATLDAMLDLMEAASRAVMVSTISGTAGVGKTALAVHWAHRVAHRFPDGQLYVNLRGFDPGGQVMAPADAVRGCLAALGVPPEHRPPGLAAQAALYRSVLSGKRILVVLDNARDAGQARPLLPGAPGCLAVVTSRNQLTPLVAADGAQPITLDVLTPMEARDLLNRRLGRDRVAAEPEAGQAIIAACARLPLALSIAAARAQQTNFPLATLAAELGQAGQRLNALDAGDDTTEARAVFSWSYTALTPPAAQLFRRLGLHPGPDIATPAAASLAGRPVPETRHSLTELTRASLLVEHVPGRYAFHDLLRAYAAELAATHDPDRTRQAATTRLLDYYVHTAYTTDRLLHAARDPIELPLVPPAPHARPEHPVDPQAAMAWLTAEHPILLAALRQAAGTGFDTHTWQLAWTLDTYLYRQGHWRDLAAAWQAALLAAGRLRDRAAQAAAHRLLARVNAELGRYADAHTHLQRVLDLYAKTGDRAGQAHTHLNVAYLWDRQERPERALDHAEQALILYRGAGHDRGQANALNAIGWCHTLLGEHRQALASCQRALPLFHRTGDRAGEAATWDSLGFAHYDLGRHAQAADCYQHALTLFRTLGDRHSEAVALTHLGDAHHAAGNPAAARDVWQQALTILADLSHPNAESVRAKLDAPDSVTWPTTDSTDSHPPAIATAGPPDRFPPRHRLPPTSPGGGRA